MTSNRIAALMLAWGALFLSTGQPCAAEESPALPTKPRIDFEREIKPILAEHCLECHGQDKAKGGLRFTERATILAKGKSGRAAVVPGKPDESEVVRRLTAVDLEDRMPPEKKEPVPKAAVQKVRQWIAEGADWKEHWAYQSLKKVQPPPTSGAGMRNGVDAFILARLREKRLAPSPEADRPTLIKRLSYDLLGLPPSIEDVAAFTSDSDPQAYERLVERLLASPHFGERWGRHWLDLARYADSDGYEKDGARPDSYLYRDWVIDAINRDLPFDQFTIEQLAGDLLPGATGRQRVATAFNRQTLTNEEGGVDQEEYRIAAVFDRTETLGAVWLGLTVGCARCHTHKYDPLPHEDYYKLFAFFNNSEETSVSLPVKADNLAELERTLAPLEQRLLARHAELAVEERQWEEEQHRRIKSKSDAAALKDLPKEIATALEAYPEKRVAKTKKRLFDYYVTNVAKDEEARVLREEIAGVQKRQRAKMMEVRTLASPLLPRQTHLFHRGEFLSPKQEVQPGVPSCLPTMHSRSDRPDRLDLAHWLVAPENPLTARVAVNHAWKHLFGEGLVKTLSDFGARGDTPSHPELLDWLAGQFQGDLNWSRKALIRLIVCSATYRQSSKHRADLSEVDPANVLLARQNRFRVESEVVRDLYLAAGGLLVNKVGGPSVFPPMPDDLAKLSYANSFSWKNSEGPDRYRRGIYTFFKRTVPHPNLMTFDSPDANVACVTRNVSNTPLQALLLLNNDVHVEASQALARRVLREAGPADDLRLALGVRLCLARPARDEELAPLRRVLAVARDYYASHTDEAAKFVGRDVPPSFSKPELAAWVAAMRIVMNCDEFLTRE